MDIGYIIVLPYVGEVHLPSSLSHVDQNLELFSMGVVLWLMNIRVVASCTGLCWILVQCLSCIIFARVIWRRRLQ